MDKFTILYSGPIRSGSFGKVTKKYFNIIKCNKCGLTKLGDFPKVDYDSAAYREEYNDSSDIDTYIELHDSEQAPRIKRIGIEKFQNKTVLDYGCGGGAFLDLIKGIANHTIAIEPFIGYHQSLKERGHEVFKYAKDAKDYIGKVDIITTFVLDMSSIVETYFLALSGKSWKFVMPTVDDFHPSISMYCIFGAFKLS